MEFNQPEAIIKEKRNYLPILKGLFYTLIIAAGLYSGYFLYQQYWPSLVVQEENIGEPLVESFGLTGTPGPDDSLFGNLYYKVNSFQTDEADSLPYSYRSNVTDDTVDMVAFQPMFVAGSQDDGTSIVLAAVTENYDSATWQPHIYDVATESLTALPNVNGHYVSDLTLSPDGNQYAYSYQIEENPTPDFTNLSEWKIAIHSFDSDEVVVIDAAAEPEWLNGGAHLLYLTQEGIYRYSMLTGEVELVFGEYAPYTFSDDLVVSLDSTAVILTIPTMNFLSVLSFQNGESSEIVGTLVEQGRIVTPDISYISPVFSLDSRYYAVTTNSFVGDISDIKLSDFVSSIEIRHISSSEVVKTIAPVEAVGGSVRTAYWGE